MLKYWFTGVFNLSCVYLDLYAENKVKSVSFDNQHSIKIEMKFNEVNESEWVLRGHFSVSVSPGLLKVHIHSNLTNALKID